MPLRRLLAYAALIAALTVSSSRAAHAGAANPAGADLAAFTAGNSIPGPLSITAGSIARIHADLLPSVPAAHILVRVRSLYGSSSSRLSFGRITLPDAPSVTDIIDNLPIGDRMRRLGRTHLNTSDGSSPDDFAICYRVNRLWGFQVIPGDPAPVKLPVSSFENSEGITVGMVMRLQSRR